MKNIIIKKEDILNNNQKETMWEFIGAVDEEDFDKIEAYKDYSSIDNLLAFPVENRTEVYSKALSEQLSADPMFPCFECLYFRPNGKVSIVKKGENAKFRGEKGKRWNVWSYRKSVCDYNESGIIIGNPKKCEPKILNFRKYLTLKVGANILPSEKSPKSANLMCIDSFHINPNKKVLWVYVKRNFE